MYRSAPSSRTRRQSGQQSALLKKKKKPTPTKKNRKKCKKECNGEKEFKKCYKSCIDDILMAADTPEPQALVVRRGTPKPQALVRSGTDPFRVESIQENLDVLCVSNENRKMIKNLFKTYNYPCTITEAPPTSTSRKLIRRRSEQANIIETIMVQIVHSYFKIIFTVRKDPSTIPKFLDCQYLHNAKLLLTDICNFGRYVQQQNMPQADRLLRKMIETVHAEPIVGKKQLLLPDTSETPLAMCRRLYESLAMIILYLEYQYKPNTAAPKTRGGNPTQRKKKKPFYLLASLGGGALLTVLAFLFGPRHVQNRPTEGPVPYQDSDRSPYRDSDRSGGAQYGDFDAGDGGWGSDGDLSSRAAQQTRGVLSNIYAGILKLMGLELNVSEEVYGNGRRVPANLG